ncbi:MAG: S9 family peptidase [Bdellovibrionaceae bacterium]|nr:S9 family peptidase [Pseudobdellovibrionaceae bacterium]
MKLFLVLMISFVFGQTSLSKENVDLIPLRDFFKNPDSINYQISPDGKWISYLKPYERRLNIFVKENKDGAQETRVTSVTDRDLGNYFWKGNQHLVYTRDFGGDENFHVFTVDLKTKTEKDVTNFPNTRAGVVDALENVKDDEMIISHNMRDKKVFDVYRLNIKTGKLVLLAKNPGTIINWITDHSGRLRAAVESEGLDYHILYRDTEDQKFSKVFSYTYKESFEPVFFTFDNRNLYALSNINRDKASVVEFDLKNRKESRIIYQHPDVDVSTLNYSRKRKVLTAAGIVTWKTIPQFFDPVMENIYNKVAEKLIGKEVRIVSTTKNEDLFIIRSLSDRSFGAFYVYDATKDELKLLAQVAPWLDEEKLNPTKPVSYLSRDGLTINGYLTLPKDKKAKNLPIVINPHGGPWHRDVWGYNPQVQFLVNRGYGVLQMNFRGSTGYGKSFLQASYKQWGLKMQDDVTDGVKWLIQEGIADPDKICIYGGSYGGYATLAGLVKEPKLYACGIDFVGVSNLFTFMNTIPPYWTTELEKLYEMVGHPEKDKAQLTATSPALNADKIKAPLLIVQGAKDPRVNKAESDQMVQALEKRGVKVQYIVKDNEGHGFRNEENRIEFYEAMEVFLKKHIGK